MKLFRFHQIVCIYSLALLSGCVTISQSIEKSGNAPNSANPILWKTEIKTDKDSDPYSEAYLEYESSERINLLAETNGIVKRSDSILFFGKNGSLRNEFGIKSSQMIPDTSLSENLSAIEMRLLRSSTSSTVLENIRGLLSNLKNDSVLFHALDQVDYESWWRGRPNHSPNIDSICAKKNLRCFIQRTKEYFISSRSLKNSIELWNAIYSDSLFGNELVGNAEVAEAISFRDELKNEITEYLKSASSFKAYYEEQQSKNDWFKYDRPKDDLKSRIEGVVRASVHHGNSWYFGIDVSADFFADKPTPGLSTSLRYALPKCGEVRLDFEIYLGYKGYENDMRVFNFGYGGYLNFKCFTFGQLFCALLHTVNLRSPKNPVRLSVGLHIETLPFVVMRPSYEVNIIAGQTYPGVHLNFSVMIHSY